jgi:hypothetical protein
MHFDLPFLVARPAGQAGFANDNDAPGIGSAPKGTAGIALCCETDTGGEPVACLRPVFGDETLGEPLHVAREGTDIIAIWRAFGRALNLPLFALSPDGALEIFSLPAGSRSYPRRGGSALTGRRTRISRRRQPPLKAFACTAEARNWHRR